MGEAPVFYTKKTIKLVNSTDISLEYSEAFKCTFHPVNSLPFTLITIYRPPKNSITCFLEEIDNLLSSLSSRTILLGDFNIPISHTSTYAKLLNQAINSHNCIQHITSPTHSSGNILDLSISHNTSNIISNTSVQNLITDHHIVTFFLQAPTLKRQSKIITFRKIQNIDLPAFKKTSSPITQLYLIQ